MSGRREPNLRRRVLRSATTSASHVTYTPYLSPGTHWIAAELSNADDTSLEPPLWSEPVISTSRG